MICETCRWTSRPGFVPAPRRDQQADQCDMMPCPNCGGQGFAHCCDGLCEQPTSLIKIWPVGRAVALNTEYVRPRESGPTSQT
jgi:hypothetical protein